LILNINNSNQYKANMTPNTETANHLKYNIKPILATKTKKQVTAFKTELKKQTGISEPTFHRYTNLRELDSNDIPSGVLKVVADLLNVPMMDLFNPDCLPF
jgi:Cro/C1-type HTH DNA-binding domain